MDEFRVGGVFADNSRCSLSVASQIDLRADLDYLLHRHSVAPLFVNRVAVEIGEDRFGHSMKAAVLRDDRFVTDVVSRVISLKGD